MVAGRIGRILPLGALFLIGIAALIYLRSLENSIADLNSHLDALDAREMEHFSDTQKALKSTGKLLDLFRDSGVKLDALGRLTVETFMRVATPKDVQNLQKALKQNQGRQIVFSPKNSPARALEIGLQTYGEPITHHLPTSRREGLGESNSLTTLCQEHKRYGAFGDRFIRMKRPFLRNLECDVTAHGGQWLRKGATILSVGAGAGEMEVLWEKKYGATVTCVDVLPPGENAWTGVNKGGLHHDVGLFDGHTLKEHEDKSFDTVIFVSVLHHAAAHSPNLLVEATRVAKKYVIIVEDLGGLPARRRNYLHDPAGIFRTAEEWRSLLMASPKDKFEMVMEAPVGNVSEPCFIVTKGSKDSIGQLTDDARGIMSKNLGSLGCKAVLQRTFVAQRVN